MMPSTTAPPTELTTDNCHTLPLNCPITLFSTADSTPAAAVPFTATAMQLTVIAGTDDRTLPSSKPVPQDCHLILSISLTQYEQILQDSLFHLRPEVRGPLHRAEFSPDLPILVELGLQPHFFSEHTPPTPDIVARLIEVLERKDLETHPSFVKELLDESLSPLETLAPWRKIESWLCRSVQQRQGEQVVGYATLWAYTAPEQAEPVIESGSAALAALGSLLQKTTEAIQSEVEQELPLLEQRLSAFSDDLVSALEVVDWETLLAEIEKAAVSSKSLLSEQVRSFFEEDDWAYVQLEETAPDTEILQLAFEGDRGRWNCLSQSHNIAEQVVFYSICPIAVPKSRYSDLSEFLMRANDGLIIGNFELDFSRGQIRYKTSLDVEGDRLTSALMRRLVYTNVKTLDVYLPGIMAVLSGEKAPLDAIATLETAASSPPSSTHANLQTDEA